MNDGVEIVKHIQEPNLQTVGLLFVLMGTIIYLIFKFIDGRTKLIVAEMRNEFESELKALRSRVAALEVGNKQARPYLRKAWARSIVIGDKEIQDSLENAESFLSV